MPLLLKNQTSDQLHASLAHAGVSPHLARLGGFDQSFDYFRG
jgi:hypothetical protein